jgi:hypothetical protein
MSKKTGDSEFARICAVLPVLTPAELEQVRARAGFLAGTATTGSPRPADEPDWLVRGIEDELRRRGLLGTGKLPATKLVPAWAATSAAVRADLRRAVERTRPWRHPWAALGRAAARALASWLVAAHIPVTPRTMLLNADKTLLALDAAFPGYVEAGLLHCALDPKLVGVD